MFNVFHFILGWGSHDPKENDVAYLHVGGGHREQAAVQLRAFWMQVVLPVHGKR